MTVNSIAELIGKTPLLKLSHISEEVGADIYIKMESLNPMGSVKDRLGLALILDAEKRGILNKDSLIVEATSGNTGISLACLCAQRGYKLALAMPESMSMERRRILMAFGAQLYLTPARDGMPGAINKAQEIENNTSGAISLKQFDNPANPDFHEATTGPEIYRDLKQIPSAFIAGVGTGGTFTGVSRYLKKQDKNVYAIAVEPEESPVLSGGKPGPHRIQGIGAGFVPGIMDTGLMDEVMTVSAESAGEVSLRLAQQEGVFVGISAGANVYAAMTLARRDKYKERPIVTIACDTGERYLSTWLFQGGQE